MRSPIVRTFTLSALLIVPTISMATSVRVQNANLDQGTNTVFVKGVTDAIASGTPIFLINAETGALMASDLNGDKQVVLRTQLPSNQKAPCTVVIRAGALDSPDAVTTVTQVRHASGCTVQSLRLQGQVVDAPIPYATVTVTLNGVTYTTVADAGGFYSLDVATATVSELVTIEATKKMTSGETIDFVSLAGSFSKLLSDASGGVLSSDTSQKVNVTNVSTAEYVLLVEANGGTAPTTVAELQQAETQVDATQLLQLAAVIKLVVDEGYSLPTGYTTILAFIQQPAAVDAFIAQVEASDPTALDSAISDILASNGLVAGFQVNQVPGRYFVTFRTEPGFLARGGDVFEFNAVRPNDCATIGSGCVGYYMTKDVTGEAIGVPFEWYIDGGTLKVNTSTPPLLDRVADPLDFAARYPNAVMTDGTLFSACGTNDTLQFKETPVGFTFTRFNDGQTVDGLSQRADVAYSAFAPVLCSGLQGTKTIAGFVTSNLGNVLARDSGAIAPRRFVRANAATGAPDEIVVEGQWALQVYANLLIDGQPVLARTIYADNVTLLASGGASGTLASEKIGAVPGVGPSSWTIDSVTGELVITYTDGWTQRVIVTDVLDSDGDGVVDLYGAFSVFNGPGGQRFASSDPAFRRNAALSIDADYMKNPPGKYWQTVVNSWTPESWEDVPGSMTGERRLVMGSQFFGFRAAAPNAGFNGGYRPPNPNSSCGSAARWRRDGFSGFAITDAGTLNVVAMTFPPGPEQRTRYWSVADTDVATMPTVPASTQRRLKVIELVRFEGLPDSPHLFPPRVNFYREMTEPSIDRGLCAFGFVPTP